MHADTEIKTQGLAKRLRERLRAMRIASIQWAAIGGVAATLWSLPQLTPMIADQGIVVWLCRGILASFGAAIMLSLAISLSAESGTDLAQRPARFLLVLAIGATLATVAVWGVDTIFKSGTRSSLPLLLLNWWLTSMVFGAVFGWAAVLNLRRREDQVKLELLSGRRALLARQVAQSRLLAARAQVDPEMVARVLNTVRNRYRAGASEADTLLDQLIAYLRLAMHRVREQQPSPANELALVRAYLALRQAESGARIALQAVHGNQPAVQQASVSLPLFLVVRQMIEEAISAQAGRMALQIEMSAAGMSVTLDTGEGAIGDAGLLRLRSALHELSGSSTELDILHHLLDSGNHRYVVTASIS